MKLLRNTILLMSCCFVFPEAYSQFITLNERKLFVGVSIGLEVINPDDINSYLYEYYDHNKLNVDKSTTDINFALREEINLSYFLTKIIELNAAYSTNVVFFSTEKYTIILIQKYTICFKRQRYFLPDWVTPIRKKFGERFLTFFIFI
jgi:hypothetical protein